MQAKWKRFIIGIAWGIAGGIAALGSSPVAAATDLTIHLDGSEPLTRQTVQYQCNAEGVAMGLPVTSFSVEYINGAGNSLAIVPIHGTSLIFARYQLRLRRPLCGKTIYLVGSRRRC